MNHYFKQYLGTPNSSTCCGKNQSVISAEIVSFIAFAPKGKPQISQSCVIAKIMALKTCLLRNLRN